MSERHARFERLSPPEFGVRDDADAGRGPLSSGDSDYARVVRPRRAHLHLRPRGDSALIAEVAPGQLLQGVMEERKWVRVAYFDWALQGQREGWILKKYAARVHKKKSVNRGGRNVRRYHLDLLDAVAQSDADIRAGRFTKETAAEHILWLETQR